MELLEEKRSSLNVQSGLLKRYESLQDVSPFVAFVRGGTSLLVQIRSASLEAISLLMCAADLAAKLTDSDDCGVEDEARVEELAESAVWEFVATNASSLSSQLQALSGPLQHFLEDDTARLEHGGLTCAETLEHTRDHKDLHVEINSRLITLRIAFNAVAKLQAELSDLSADLCVDEARRTRFVSLCSESAADVLSSADAHAEHLIELLIELIDIYRAQRTKLTRHSALLRPQVVRSMHSALLMAPESPSEGAPMIMTASSASDGHTHFVLDRLARLRHVSTGLVVGPRGHEPINTTALVLQQPRRLKDGQPDASQQWDLENDVFLHNRMRPEAVFDIGFGSKLPGGRVGVFLVSSKKSWQRFVLEPVLSMSAADPMRAQLPSLLVPAHGLPSDMRASLSADCGADTIVIPQGAPVLAAAGPGAPLLLSTTIAESTANLAEALWVRDGDRIRNVSSGECLSIVPPTNSSTSSSAASSWIRDKTPVSLSSPTAAAGAAAAGAAAAAAPETQPLHFRSNSSGLCSLTESTRSLSRSTIFNGADTDNTVMLSTGPSFDAWTQHPNGEILYTGVTDLPKQYVLDVVGRGKSGGTQVGLYASADGVAENRRFFAVHPPTPAATMSLPHVLPYYIRERTTGLLVSAVPRSALSLAQQDQCNSRMVGTSNGSGRDGPMMRDISRDSSLFAFETGVTAERTDDGPWHLVLIEKAQSTSDALFVDTGDGCVRHVRSGRKWGIEWLLSQTQAAGMLVLDSSVAMRHASTGGTTSTSTAMARSGRHWTWSNTGRLCASVDHTVGVILTDSAQPIAPGALLFVLTHQRKTDGDSTMNDANGDTQYSFLEFDREPYIPKDASLHPALTSWAFRFETDDSRTILPQVYLEGALFVPQEKESDANGSRSGRAVMHKSDVLSACVLNASRVLVHVLSGLELLVSRDAFDANRPIVLGRWKEGERNVGVRRVKWTVDARGRLISDVFVLTVDYAPLLCLCACERTAAEASFAARHPLTVKPFL